MIKKWIKLSSIVLVLVAAACADTMSTTGAFVVDTSAYAALAVEHTVLGRPCTAKVTKVCVDKELAIKLRDARLLTMAALTNYQNTRKSYNAAVLEGKTPDESAVKASAEALRGAVDNLQYVLSLQTVQEIIASLKE